MSTKKPAKGRKASKKTAQEDGSNSAPNVTQQLPPVDFIASATEITSNPAAEQPAEDVIFHNVTPVVPATVTAEIVPPKAADPAPLPNRVRKLEAFGALIVLASGESATSTQLAKIAARDSIANRINPGRGLYTYLGRALDGESSVKVLRAHLIKTCLSDQSPEGRAKAKGIANRLLHTVDYGRGGYVHADQIQIVLDSASDDSADTLPADVPEFALAEALAESLASE